ncbi:MAG: alpha/beta hydrolase [Myxococcota bacterium]
MLAWAMIVACQSPDGDDPVDTTVETLPREVRAITIDRDAFALEGTLTLPERTSDAGVPGVVLVHGSGPNSRDVPVSGQLNMAFGLEFDRTPSDAIVVDDFIEDAAAAASYLAALNEVDRVYVVGHSQGGSFVPRRLADDPRLAGGVILAGIDDAVTEAIAAWIR